MSGELWDDFKYLDSLLIECGFEQESAILNETLEFSTSSSELYFKVSGILKFFLSQDACSNEIAMRKLNDLNARLDELLT